LGLTRDDVLLCAEGFGGPLQLLAAAWVGARLTSSTSDATVVFLGDWPSPYVACPAVRSAAVIGVCVSEAEIARVFPNYRTVIRVSEEA
jgi:hypothetical protein